jgi:transmembrane sensor
MKKENTDLIIRYLSGNASEDERSEMQEWLRVEENRGEFEEFRKVWEASGSLNKEFSADTEAAWNEFQSLINKKPAKAKIFYLQPLRIAAALALFIFSFYLVRFYIDDAEKGSQRAQTIEQPKPAAPVVSNINTLEPLDSSLLREEKKPEVRRRNAPEMVTVFTTDSIKMFVLPDSSRVFLNINSKLTYPKNFIAAVRKVELHGEGFFEVEHKDKQAFEVKCRNSITRVLGTSFNVKGYDLDKEVEVTVLTGLVELCGAESVNSDHSARILLAAGDMGVYSLEKQSVVKMKASKKSKNSKWWQKGLFGKIKNFFDKLKGKKKAESK